MIKKTIGCVLAFFILMISSWGIPLASSVSEGIKPVVVSDVFTAGTVGNKAIFEVRNNTQKTVHGVRMASQSPQEWSTITKITPQSATLKPGEAMDFTVEFSVIDDAPDEAKDLITLFFDSDENIEFDNRWYHIKITIKAEEETDETKYDVAYFVVKVEGAGYSTSYGGGTWIISGSATTFIQVPRGQSASQILLDKKKEIEGEDKCERSLATQGLTEENPGWPKLFTSGPKLTIVDEPYFDRNKFFETAELKDNWQFHGKNGPNIFDIYCKQGGR